MIIMKEGVISSPVGVRTSNHSTQAGGRGRAIFEFQGSLVYRVSSRTDRATHRNPVSGGWGWGWGRIFLVIKVSPLYISESTD